VGHTFDIRLRINFDNSYFRDVACRVQNSIERCGRRHDLASHRKKTTTVLVSLTGRTLMVVPMTSRSTGTSFRVKKEEAARQAS
jgi:hypothetical protein